MSDLEDDLPDEALVVARIEILRYLDDQDDLVIYTSHDAAGEQLALVEVLGMLRLTEDTAIRAAFADEEP